MTHEEDEFYELVGCRTSKCGQTLLMTIKDRATGEVFLDNVEMRCGLLVNETGPENSKCLGCEKYVVLCECGNGLPLEHVLGDSGQLICTNDAYFCRRGNIDRARLESHEEDFPPSRV